MANMDILKASGYWLCNNLENGGVLGAARGACATDAMLGSRHAVESMISICLREGFEESLKPSPKLGERLN